MEKDKILSGFLNIEENRDYYQKYMERPTAENRKGLDELFRKHMYLICYISYFVKMVHFESKHFDRKQRKRNEMLQLTLDKLEDSGQRIVELFPENKVNEYFGCRLEDLIEDPDLYHSIQSLTDKQKTLLNLIFIEEMTDTEIAKLLGVSQQAITKAKKKALTKLKNEIQELKEGGSLNAST